MEALTSVELSQTEGHWQYEPKWDGFRCLAFRNGSHVELRAKSGKPLARYFPEVVARLAALPAARFVLDGELVIDAKRPDAFAQLQLRLHPAESRVRRLAAESPATLIVFDMLVDTDGTRLLEQPLSIRRIALERFMRRIGSGVPHLVLSPRSTDLRQALRWLRGVGSATDGVIAKRLDQPYRSGERAMVKVKRRLTVDCVVGGFRYQQGTQEVGSLLLGLYGSDGRLDHVGFTSTLPRAERTALTRRLEELRAEPGFAGNAPGGPSRWSGQRDTRWEPLRPELVVEVSVDHVSGSRFRHGAKLLRWRPDKDPKQCTFDQLRSVRNR